MTSGVVCFLLALVGACSAMPAWYLNARQCFIESEASMRVGAGLVSSSGNRFHVYVFYVVYILHNLHFFLPGTKSKIGHSFDNLVSFTHAIDKWTSSAW